MVSEILISLELLQRGGIILRTLKVSIVAKPVCTCAYAKCNLKMHVRYSDPIGIEHVARAYMYACFYITEIRVV